MAPSAVERLKAPIYTTIPGVECSGVEGSGSFESRLIVYIHPFSSLQVALLFCTN